MGTEEIKKRQATYEKKASDNEEDKKEDQKEDGEKKDKDKWDCKICERTEPTDVAAHCTKCYANYCQTCTEGVRVFFFAQYYFFCIDTIFLL